MQQYDPCGVETIEIPALDFTIDLTDYGIPSCTLDEDFGVTFALMEQEVAEGSCSAPSGSSGATKVYGQDNCDPSFHYHTSETISQTGNNLRIIGPAYTYHLRRRVQATAHYIQAWVYIHCYQET